MMETMEKYPEVFDVGLALSSVGGDHEFLAELVGLTQAAWPTLLANIRSGMARGDLRAVEMTARLAKAAARNVSAKRAYESALQLEAMARKGDLPAVQRASVDLEREVELLRIFLATLTDNGCSS
jgi:HPt (histidine-containing phosphotransfer) domain-containing protein